MASTITNLSVNSVYNRINLPRKKNYSIKHTILGSTFNYLMSQLTILAIHFLFIVTNYYY